ncbi:MULTISPECIES: MoaD/ThiS family protein [Microbacterium]|uniref:Molybdopterin converting factor n=1 Tax=Microbacterium testaceum TaxID=2033 RepID=A0A147F3U1_MICTE|nr:MoaD/ThiS family protein [Microbacterium testaceum]KTS02109.1 molybdopterin converting factor [Microbacterium testaceum]KTS08262.1 molybdopterin converting factor [Microbacterium testaceum]KTS59742.1 molybdopterin converting factor [Microbacterium testaceum]KTS88400.1 molybdopterin converting factor [Microbacterium testaceum]
MSVRVRYFAAAAEAAGTDAEDRTEPSLSALRAAVVADHPALAGILDRCAVLLDGTRHDDDAPLEGVTHVDVLPPFAGG